MAKINNENVEYKELSKIQRLAIFLIAVGPESSSQVLAGFDDSDIEKICSEIGKMTMVDYDLKREAIEEFASIIGGGFRSMIGGVPFAQKALEMSKGPAEAKEIMCKIEPNENLAQMIAEIGNMEPKQVVSLLEKEQTQVVAYTLSHLPLPQIMKIVKLMPEEVRDQVITEIAQMQEVRTEMIEKVAKVLKKQLRNEEKTYTTNRIGGVDVVAEMLNKLGKDISRSVLSKIEKTSTDLAEQINKKMFSFEDLLKLSKEAMQRVTREIETNDLVLALKGASKELSAMLMGSVSKRAAESLRDELEMLGAVKVKLVIQAQERIVAVVKRLESEGAIEIGGGTEDVIQ